MPTLKGFLLSAALVLPPLLAHGQTDRFSAPPSQDQQQSGVGEGSDCGPSGPIAGGRDIQPTPERDRCLERLREQESQRAHQENKGSRDVQGPPGSAPGEPRP